MILEFLARKKNHPNKKGRNKIISADDMILYMGNPKDCTKKTARNQLTNSVKLRDIKLADISAVSPYT
jgi:hypothetical protein